jgi:hypothetical protein
MALNLLFYLLPLSDGLLSLRVCYLILEIVLRLSLLMVILFFFSCASSLLSSLESFLLGLLVLAKGLKRVSCYELINFIYYIGR